jgi:hypothetical protein
MPAVAFRRAIGVFLCVLLGLPSSLLAAPLGTLKGTLTVQGRPLKGMVLSLVDIDSGTVHRLTSGDGGRFEAKLAPGRYVVSAEGRGGLVIAEAPRQVPVVAGGIAEARIDLAPIQVAQADTGAAAPPVPEASEDATVTKAALTTTEAGTTLTHDQISCFIAGEFPLLDASIMPVPNVARARIYFKSALIETYYYVEMTPAEGKFVGKLPRPRVEASPITYYVEATTTDFTDLKLPEVSALVIENKDDCPDKRVAAIGPVGEVTVFSSATGLAIAPAGFAAAAGGLLGIGGLVAAIGGAAAAGVATSVVVFNETPAPPPPTATPSDQPTAPPTGTVPPITP